MTRLRYLPRLLARWLAGELPTVHAVRLERAGVGVRLVLLTASGASVLDLAHDDPAWRLTRSGRVEWHR